MTTKTYQTGAYLLTMDTLEGHRILRAEHCPSAPSPIRRGRDQGYLAYPTREDAERAAAALAAWELVQRDEFDARRYVPADPMMPYMMYFQNLTVEYSATEVIL